MTIAHEPFDLERVAESVTSIFYPQTVEKGVAFSMPLIDITETALIGDSLRLNQVLINLLSNALKFTPPGGAVRLKIEQLQKKNERVRLRFAVSDTGIGMSEEFMTRLFCPLNRRAAPPAKNTAAPGWAFPSPKTWSP